MSDIKERLSDLLQSFEESTTAYAPTQNDSPKDSSDPKHQDKPAFIYVGQGRTARFIHGLSDAYNMNGLKLEGLCTAKFHNCNIIVLRSKDGSKISLTHADININGSEIDHEIEWVGSDCDKWVYFRKNQDAIEDHHSIFTLCKSKAEFKKISVVDDVEEGYAITVSRSGEVQLHQKLNFLSKINALYHPLSYSDLIRSFNTSTSWYLHQKLDPNLTFARIIFDGTLWCYPEAQDLAFSTDVSLIVRSDADLAHQGFFSYDLPRAIQVLKNAFGESLYKQKKLISISPLILIYLKRCREELPTAQERPFSEFSMAVLSMLANNKELFQNEIHRSWMVELNLILSGPISQIPVRVEQVLINMKSKLYTGKLRSEIRQILNDIMLHIEAEIRRLLIKLKKLIATPKESLADPRLKYTATHWKLTDALKQLLKRYKDLATSEQDLKNEKEFSQEWITQMKPHNENLAILAQNKILEHASKPKNAETDKANEPATAASSEQQAMVSFQIVKKSATSNPQKTVEDEEFVEVAKKSDKRKKKR